MEVVTLSNQIIVSVPASLHLREHLFLASLLMAQL
jgi:hypothetical protein